MDKELLQRKTSQMERALQRVKERLPANFSLFKTDDDAQDIVYRNFHIAVQNCVDISNHVIAEKRWEIPRTMGESFEILSLHKIIPPLLAKSLRNMTVLRNIIVHDYTRVKLDKAYPLLRDSLKILPLFSKKVVNAG